MRMPASSYHAYLVGLFLISSSSYATTFKEAKDFFKSRLSIGFSYQEEWFHNYLEYDESQSQFPEKNSSFTWKKSEIFINTSRELVNHFVANVFSVNPLNLMAEIKTDGTKVTIMCIGGKQCISKTNIYFKSGKDCNGGKDIVVDSSGRPNSFDDAVVYDTCKKEMLSSRLSSAQTGKADEYTAEHSFRFRSEEDATRAAKALLYMLEKSGAKKSAF